MFIIANALRWSAFMLQLNQVLNLLIVEKLCLHSSEVMGNVQPILIKRNTFGKFWLSQTLMAFAKLDGRGTSTYWYPHPLSFMQLQFQINDVRVG